MKERYGSLDDLDVSIDGVDIPLDLNSLVIFCRKHIRFVEIVTAINKRLLSIKRSRLGPLKLRRRLGRFIRSLRYLLSKVICNVISGLQRRNQRDVVGRALFLTSTSLEISVSGEKTLLIRVFDTYVRFLIPIFNLTNAETQVAS